MKFIDRVVQIVEEAVTIHDRLSAEQRKFEEDFQREEITGKALAQKREANQRARDAARQDALAEFSVLRAQYAAAARQRDVVGPEMLSDDARLLQADMPELTPDTFAVLAERNSNNPLLTRMLFEYAAQHPDGEYDLSILRPDATERIRQFDDFVALAETCVRDVRGLQIGFFLDGKCTPAACTEEM